jgi:hypothetical protein
MKPRCCPYCHQTLPETRLGVRLTPLQARIFDLIQRAGDQGITRSDVYLIAFDGRDTEINAVSVHINQINEMLVETDYRIVGGGFYRLKAVEVVA